MSEQWWEADPEPLASPGVNGHESSAGRRLVLTTIAAVEPESVRWLWDGRLVLSMLNVTVGEPGLGKSTLSYDLAAKLTRGDLAGDLYGQPVDVLIITYEDHIASVVRPRLEAAGADLQRVHAIGIKEADGSEGLLTLPDDLAIIREAIERTHARLLIVDPIVAALSGEINSHRDQDVRRVLAPLAQLAEEHSVAAVVVMHVNKSQAKELLRRIGGSVGFTGAARSVLLVGRDPEDPEGERGLGRVLVHGKCNVGALAPSLRFEIESVRVGEIETSRLRFLGECELTTSELLGGDNGDESSAMDVEEAILAALADGPKPSREIKAQIAQELGCSKKTVERAAVKMSGDEITIESGGFPRTTTWALASGDTTVGTSLTPTRVPTARAPVPVDDLGPGDASRDTREMVSLLSGDLVEQIKSMFDAVELTEPEWAEYQRAVGDIQTRDYVG